MIFITGGRSQGKTTFAKSLQMPIIDDIEMKIKDWIMDGIEDQEQLLKNIEIEMNRALKDEHTSVWEENIVLISREIGCGIVPIDKKESMWREVSGRISCIIAKHATEVYKMESGIAVKIK